MLADGIFADPGAELGDPAVEDGRWDRGKTQVQDKGEDRCGQGSTSLCTTGGCGSRPETDNVPPEEPGGMAMRLSTLTYR